MRVNGTMLLVFTMKSPLQTLTKSLGLWFVVHACEMCTLVYSEHNPICWMLIVSVTIVLELLLKVQGLQLHGKFRYAVRTS
jgi:hypothetical protein